ncbi:MAG TPA: histidinol-phosphate transaminase [Candidatus Binataceae bacterium]|nr:histidinol-phosphate transaminase [Candidatus Binataceae bacterium]
MITRRDLLWGAGSLLAATAGAALTGYNRTPEPRERPRPVTPPAGSFLVESGVLRLDRNESPYGPSPAVVETLKSMTVEDCCRWPEQEAATLRNAIGRLHHVAADHVVVGAGSTDIMRVCASRFLGPGKHLLMAAPGFERIADYARATGASVAEVPLDRLYQQDLQAMRQRVTAATGMVYIANPFTPTGTMLRRDQMLDFLEALPKTLPVLVDEAYIEYARWPGQIDPSLISQTVRDQRLIVTRTFSKIYGMPGMRIGYACAAPATAQRIALGGTQHDLSARSLRAATAALTDPGYVKSIARLNEDARQEFFNQADARMLQPVDSNANFVLLFIDDCLEVANHFARHGIRVAGDFPGLAQSIRVTLGTPAQMREFWRVFDLKRTLRPF